MYGVIVFVIEVVAEQRPVEGAGGSLARAASTAVRVSQRPLPGEASRRDEPAAEVIEGASCPRCRPGAAAAGTRSNNVGTSAPVRTRSERFETDERTCDSAESG